MDRLVDTHILLGREQKRSLRVLAADQGSSLSLIVRDAVDHYFGVVAGPTPDRLRLAARAAVGRLQPPDDGAADDTGGGEGGGGPWE